MKIKIICLIPLLILSLTACNNQSSDDYASQVIKDNKNEYSKQLEAIRDKKYKGLYTYENYSYVTGITDYEDIAYANKKYSGKRVYSDDRNIDMVYINDSSKGYIINVKTNKYYLDDSEGSDSDLIDNFMVFEIMEADKNYNISEMEDDLVIEWPSGSLYKFNKDYELIYTKTIDTEGESYTKLINKKDDTDDFFDYYLNLIDTYQRVNTIDEVKAN